MQSQRQPRVSPPASKEAPPPVEHAVVPESRGSDEAPPEVPDEQVPLLPAREISQQDGEATPSDLAPDEQVSDAAHDQLAGPDPSTFAPDAEETRNITMGPLLKDKPGYDYPIVRNGKVKFWLEQYGTRQKSGFAKGLERSGRYVDMFRRIFREAGIPEDLVYLAHVESAYKPTAYSRARAKGVYQFIAATGKSYDLRIDYWVDERSDPEKAAYAAAAYLSDLYDEFGDWYLAMAGYNAGEGRVRLAIRKTGSRDFWKLA
ncbi:MAG: transglycosylase SLT domain-containing protein, partial [Acidobacteriota bacterium]|nr:transglycosylase SLT domain-containing protein [Acidobacteriota bacterium]